MHPCSYTPTFTCIWNQSHIHNAIYGPSDTHIYIYVFDFTPTIPYMFSMPAPIYGLSDTNISPYESNATPKCLYMNSIPLPYLHIWTQCHYFHICIHCHTHISKYGFSTRSIFTYLYSMHIHAFPYKAKMAHLHFHIWTRFQCHTHTSI